MKLETEFLIPGMELEADIYLPNNSNIPFITGGKTLSNDDIVKIKTHGINEVNVAIHDYKETFTKEFQKLTAETIQSNDIDKIMALSLKFKEMTSETKEVKFDMSKYVDNDLDTLTHNVNTVCMALAIAKKYNQTVIKQEQIPLDLIAQAAMLQDIGRVAKDPRMFEKLKFNNAAVLQDLRKTFPKIPESTLDLYQADLHSIYSYLLIKTHPKIDSSVKKAVLCHNEHYKNNRGPIGLAMQSNENKLSIKMSAILKMVEMYDIALYKTKENNSEKPFNDVPGFIERCVSEGYTSAFWTNILKNCLPVYQVSDKVELSDGTIARVMKVNPEDMLRPIVVSLDGKRIDLKSENLEVLRPVSKSSEKQQEVTQSIA